MAFRNENPFWISNNAWWTTLYNSWIAGYTGGGGGGGSGSLSTSMTQSEWQTWFNNHSYSNTSDLTAIQTFMGTNATWCAQTSWWYTMYQNWSTGGGGGGGDNNFSTSWTQSQWQTWFNNHSYSNTSDLTAIQTFMGTNPAWCAQTSWWYTMYQNWLYSYSK
jgi:hypothetical protein